MGGSAHEEKSEDHMVVQSSLPGVHFLRNSEAVCPSDFLNCLFKMQKTANHHSAALKGEPGVY